MSPVGQLPLLVAFAGWQLA